MFFCLFSLYHSPLGIGAVLLYRCDCVVSFFLRPNKKKVRQGSCLKRFYNSSHCAFWPFGKPTIFTYKHTHRHTNRILVFTLRCLSACWRIWQIFGPGALERMFCVFVCLATATTCAAKEWALNGFCACARTFGLCGVQSPVAFCVFFCFPFVFLSCSVVSLHFITGMPSLILTKLRANCSVAQICSSTRVPFARLPLSFSSAEIRPCIARWRMKESFIPQPTSPFISASSDTIKLINVNCKWIWGFRFAEKSPAPAPCAGLIIGCDCRRNKEQATTSHKRSVLFQRSFGSLFFPLLLVYAFHAVLFELLVHGHACADCIFNLKINR